MEYVTEKERPYCVNCKHYDRKKQGVLIYRHDLNMSLYSFNTCTKSPKHDLVTGEPKYRDCDAERSEGGICGLDGKYFEDKRI